MKILFCDIDSVLNHSKYAEDCYQGEEYAGDVFVEDKVPLCKDNIIALKHIFEAVPDLKVVWSTDWRLYDKPEYNGFKNPRQWLEAQDWMKDRIVGKTPKKMSSTHYEEIRMWFSENEYYRCAGDGKACIDQFMPGNYINVDKFAILDDYATNAMFSYFKDNFFQCQYDTGLTMEIAEKVISHFK